MLKRVSISESVTYGILFTFFFVGFSMLYNIIVNPTKPVINVDLTIETFISIISIMVIFSFQRSGRLSLRTIFAILTAIALAIYMVVLEFNIGSVFMSIAGNGEKEAFGLLGSIGKFLYEKMFSKHLETATAMIMVAEMTVRVVKIVGIEVFVLFLGHVTGIFPILSEKEEILMRMRMADWFD